MKLAAVLLAAGLSQRFGLANKLLANVGGEPMVRRVARAVAACPVTEFWAVTGADHEALRAALLGLPFRCVMNSSYRDGLGASVAFGVAQLDNDIDGVLIVPGDMAWLETAFLNQIIDAFARTGGERIVHAIDETGQQRNPVLWPRRCISDLSKLSGESGAKSLIASDPIPRLTVCPSNDLCLDDIDTPEQLASFQQWNAMTGSTKNVLFLCTHNSCRSVIAESILNAIGGGRFRGFSAGSHPSGRINPGAIALLTRKGYPTVGLRSKTWDEFAAPGAAPIDYIITVCADAAGETCPFWPGHPTSAHWGVADPSRFEGTDSERQAAFDETHRLLYDRIKAFIDLPFDALDPSALKQRLMAIGTMT